MTPATALKLGRISNLPTVWTNVVAGAALAGTLGGPGVMLVLLLAFSTLYTAGMYLNDYYDRTFDARFRPARPIPAGDADAETVRVAGFAMLACGVLGLAATSLAYGTLATALPAALALATLIVVYDRHHKDNPTGPLLMGLCRVLVYIGTAAVLSGIPGPASMLGSVVLLAYLVLLTATAKRGATDTTVALLIAGISLLDAALIAFVGRPGLALAATAGFPATLALQRFVRGT